jgi:hypothetical protein
MTSPDPAGAVRKLYVRDWPLELKHVPANEEWYEVVLATDYDALSQQLAELQDKYATDNEGALRCACEYEPDADGFPGKRLQVCGTHHKLEQQLAEMRGQKDRQAFVDDFDNALTVGRIMAAFKEVDGHTLFESYDLLRQRIDVLRDALAALSSPTSASREGGATPYVSEVAGYAALLRDEAKDPLDDDGKVIVQASLLNDAATWMERLTAALGWPTPAAETKGKCGGSRWIKGPAVPGLFNLLGPHHESRECPGCEDCTARAPAAELTKRGGAYDAVAEMKRAAQPAAEREGIGERIAGLAAKDPPAESDEGRELLRLAHADELAWCAKVRDDLASKLDSTWPLPTLLLRAERALSLMLRKQAVPDGVIEGLRVARDRLVVHSFKTEADSVDRAIALLELK